MKNLLFGLIILGTVLSLSSCKKKEKDSNNQTKIIVTVKLNGNVVDGAEVVLYYDSGDETKYTGSNGKVEFDVDEGDYFVDAYYYDDNGTYYYGESNDIFHVSKGEVRNITINLY